MNVCFVTRAMPAHGRGGMEDHAMALAAGISARGHSVTVVTTGHARKEVEQTAGVEIHYVKGTRSRAYSRAWRSRSTKKVLELHAERRFDVLHSQSIGAYDFLKKRLNRKLPLPTVVTLHGTPFDEVASSLNIIRFSPSIKMTEDIYNIWYWTDQFFRYYLGAVARADGVIATSNEQQELIRKILRADPRRLHRVYNGMDLDLFSPEVDTARLRRELRVSAETGVLLCVARFARDKGIDNVIKALPSIIDRCPNVLLVLVGDGEQRKYLTRLARRLRVEDHVSFQGFVDLSTLPAYFNLCDVFINATIRRNGYDLTMLEAMACQKVVISSDVGSTPTLIRDSVDGLLVPVGDAKALADTTVLALQSPTLRDAIGHRARIKALKSFSLDGMVEGTLAVYDALRRSHG